MFFTMAADTAKRNGNEQTLNVKTDRPEVFTKPAEKMCKNYAKTHAITHSASFVAFWTGSSNSIEWFVGVKVM